MVMHDQLHKASCRILSIDDDIVIHRTYAAILASTQESAFIENYLGIEESGPAPAQGLELLDDDPEISFRLDQSMSGEEGLQKLIDAKEAGDPYAVIYLDMRMPPGWDGLETAERIRKVDPAVRIILITAYSDYELDEIRLRIGYDFVFLSKPIDAVVLQQMTALLFMQWKKATQLVEDRGVVSNLSTLESDSFYPIRILLVDDSPTIRAVYGELLQRNDKYLVKTAASMADALELVESFIPDLSIIDHLMPEGDGSELTRRLLAQNHTKSSLVVILTHRTDIEQMALEAGAIDVIYKDDPTEVFLQRIHSIERYLTAQHELRVKVVTEVEAKQQYHWLESIFSAIPDGLLVTDERGCIQRANRPLYQMLGISSSDLIGLGLDYFLERYTSLDGERADCLLHRQGGGTIPLKLQRIPLNTANSKLNGELVVLHSLQDRFENEDARRVNSAKDEFLASMSHELRTPLASIIGNSELLMESCGASCQHKSRIHSIESIGAAGRNQLALVNDILDMSKIEAGKFSIESAP